MRHYSLAVLLSMLAALLLQCHPRADQSALGATTADAASSPIAASPMTPSSTPIADAAAPAEQRFALRDGRTAVVGPDDHVVIVGADGGSESESYCGANGISYARAATFFTQVARLVGASDKAALAELVNFPLRASTSVKTRAQFLDQYGSIFTPSEVSAIVQADPGEIFCRNGAFMLGDGELWAAPDTHGEYRLTTVNPPVPKSRNAAIEPKHR